MGNSRGSTLNPARPRARAGSMPKLRKGKDGRPRATITLGVHQTALLLGEEDLSTWDMEELRQGRRRDSKGNFSGRPPKVIARPVYLELVRRILDEANLAILDLVMPAIVQLGAIIEGGAIDKEDSIRLKAIQEVLNRVLGRPEQKVAVSSEQRPYQKVERSIVDRDLGEYEDEKIIEVESSEA